MVPATAQASFAAAPVPEHVLAEHVTAEHVTAEHVTAEHAVAKASGDELDPVRAG